MNSNLFKTVFSQRLGALIAVGEHTCGQGKATGSHAAGHVNLLASAAAGASYFGVVSLGFAFVSLAWAAPASNALPSGGQVAQGAAAISQSGANMAITQSTGRAVVNWQSFDIGKDAKVNIVQPNAQAVLLNRVTGAAPSQIFGQMSANGQVVLVNPNGVTFGKDGSVSAAGLTASTLNISDADFMAGRKRFTRDGATGQVVNQGTLSAAPGGYVALLGASVSNEGKIYAPQGNVALGAAEVITLPMTGTGRIKMELSPSAINAAVANQKGGSIVTEGGQVYMQAAAMGSAMASVLQWGSIDTSGEQGGTVHLLADGGQIKVDGSITANSMRASNKGGDIIIGRDTDTGVLAKFTDVSNAQLQSNRALVETSGDVLKTDNVSVKAGEWLLDPYNITIAASGASGTAYGTAYTSGADSIILASDIQNSLNAGTSVTLTTGAGGASTGNIAVNESISKTAGADATLTLQAHGNITVAASKTITSTVGKLNLVFNSDLDGTGGGSIVFNSNSGVTSHGGNITLGGGTALDGSGSAIGDGATSYAGISLASAALNAGGGNIAMTGTTYTNAAANTAGVHGILVTNGSIQTAGAGTITLNGYSTTTTDTLSKAVSISGATITGGSTGTVTILGDSRSATAAGNYLYGVALGGSAVVTSLGGNIAVTGYGGNGSGGFATNIGVSLSNAKIAGVGAGTVTISGTGGQGAAGSNIGVYTENANTVVSSQGADINITGQGGNGTKSVGVLIAGGTVGLATGTTSANVNLTTDSVQLQTSTINSGTGTTTIQNKSAGTLVNVGGADVLNTTPLTLGITNAEMNLITAGTLKIGSTTSGAMTTSTSVTTAASTGNVYLQSGSTLTASHAITSGAGLYLQTTGGALTNSAALSGTNVSLDNSNGSINLATGAITSGAGITAAADGITVSGALTATTNLNVYGASGSANGVNTSANWSGQYINAIGTTSTGFTGFSWNGGTINTTGTGGTSTASTVKGISAASTTASLGFGGFMMFANGAANAATGTTLTLAGEATTLTTGQNTKQRGILVQGGRTLTMSGDVTLDGSSKSSEGISFGGTLNMATVAGVTNKLTIKGTAAASSNSGLTAVNLSGVINSNASTSSINIMGDAKNLSGTNWDRAINISGAVNGGTSNINIQSTGANINTSAAITGANISIDNTNGTIHASTGALTEGSGTSGSSVGIELGSTITATGNLNVFGASTGNIGLRLISSASISGGNIQATGRTTNGANGVLLNGSNTITTTGTSGTSLVRGITTNGGTHALLGSAGLTLNAASGNSLTLWGDGTNTTSAAASFNGGTSNLGAITNGAVTLRGTSNNQTALMLTNGAVTANANSALTLQGTTSGSGRNGVETVTAGGVNLSNGASVSIDGQNTATSGAGVGINLNGNGIGKATGATTAGSVTLSGSTSSSSGSTGVLVPANITNDSNISITGNVASAASTGVSISGAVVSTETGTAIGVSSNQGITGTGAIGDTTNKNANVTFTQNGDSTYSGAINAANFTKEGGGNLLFTNSVSSTTFNINAGNVQVGDGSAATASATATLDAVNIGIAAGSNLTFNRAEAYSNASVITGTGSLIQAGTGVVTLTGDSSAFAGATTVTAGKTLAIGTGGSLGAAGSTLTLTDSASNLSFTNTSGTSTVASTISGAGTVTENGAGGTGLLLANNTYTGTTTITSGTLQIGNGGTTGTLGTGAVVDNGTLTFNHSDAVLVSNTISGSGTLSQTGAGTTTLTADNTYSGTTTISGGTLQVGNAGTTGTLGAGDVTLSNNANLSYARAADTTIANTITGTGNVSASITGDSNDLTVANAINLTNGTVNLVTDANLSVTQAISTTNTSSSAILLAAGKSTAAGTATGGDVSLSGIGALTAGSGARITIQTGSVAGSTGLGILAGNNRYNSDETTTNYTAALDTGAYAIYREQPLVTVQVNSASKTYDGNTFSGGSLNTSLAAGSLVNGDTFAAVTANTTFGGTAQGAKNAAVTPYVISASDTGGTGSNLNALGYGVTYNSGELTVTQKEVALAAAKTYDGGNTLTGTQLSISTGVGTETLNYTGATLFSKNVADNSSNYVNAVTLTDGSNGELASNYTAVLTGAVAGKNTVAITKKDLIISATASEKTYDASTSATTSLSSDKFASDTLMLTQTSATFDTKNVGTGKTVTVAGLAISGTDADNYNLTDNSITTTAHITPKDLTLSSITAASKTYDGNNTAVITQVGLTGFVGSETLGATATGTFDNKNAGLRTVNVNTANTALSDDLASGGLASNYQLVPSSVGSATTIAQKDAVVTANSDVSKVYNGANQTVSGFTATGLVNGETAAVLTGVSAGATGKNAGTYNAIASGTDNNYALSFVDGRLVIAPKAAIVEAAPLTTVSNGAVFTQAPATKLGFVPGEDVTVTGLASGISEGSYNSQLQVAPANSATVLDNYLIQIVNAALLITPGNIAMPPVRPVFLSGPPTITSRLSWTGFSGVNTNTSSAQRASSATAASGGAASLTSAVPANNALPQVCTPEGLQECDCEDTSIESVEFCLSPSSKR